MKINGISTNNVISIYGDNKKNVTSKQNVNKKDTLEISSTARSLSNLVSDGTIENSPQKIEAIKNRLSNGTYNVDSKLIAKKMLDAIKGREV